jgi:cytochrome o ubiquinol oxidase operon protein cyoD
MSKQAVRAVTAEHETDREHGTYASYITGFILSIFLTMVAYMTAVRHLLRGNAFVALIVGLALIQFFVQLFFFLHLGRETRPRWKLLVLFFMVLIVLILVLGSLWIMSNLNYRMTPEQMDQYMINQNGGI